MNETSCDSHRPTGWTKAPPFSLPRDNSIYGRKHFGVLRTTILRSTVISASEKSGRKFQGHAEEVLTAAKTL